MPKLVSLEYKFKTTTEDKDWNSQVGVRVFANDGQQLGERFCCSSDRDRDVWPEGHETAFMPIEAVTRVASDLLPRGTFRILFKAVGNDKWAFNASLRATFDDGSTKTWSFDSNVIESRDGNQSLKDLTLGSL